VPFLLKL